MNDPLRWTRREFAFAAAGAAVAAAAPRDPAPDSETLVQQLYRSLSAEQRSKICFPFDHPLRSKVDNNWKITDIAIGDFFTPDQRAMVAEIFEKLHNPDFYGQVDYHIREDGGGIGNYSVALFGEPGGGKFEFVLTGRHCTVRCDGDSVDGAAFGGPIFYGHASRTFNEPPSHSGNVYWYQAKRANEVFQALDGKQRESALAAAARSERAAAVATLQGPSGRFDGLPVAAMSADQRALVEQTLADLLLPFRERDRDETMRLIQRSGGVEALSMAFYRAGDLGDDGVWDVWQLEGPGMLWLFRGAPHVHVWVRVG